MGAQEPGTSIVRGLRILTEVTERRASGRASTADLDRRDLDRLTAVGLLRREGDDVALGEGLERLLGGLSQRSDLIDLARPLVEAVQERLGTPIVFVAGSARSADAGDVLEVSVQDTTGEVAGTLRAPIAGLAPEAEPLLRRELVTLAAGIARLLPARKRRPTR